MLLLTGPPGSDLARPILAEVREALARGRSDFRLVVPTATMAEHLRHRLAREGYVFRPGSIVTLSRFLATTAGESREITRAGLCLAVECALARLRPRAFERVGALAGFQSAIAALIEEVSSSGAGSETLATAIAREAPGDEAARAFAQVYAAVEEEIARGGNVLHGARLRQAGEWLRWNGMAGLGRVFFDGFFTLNDPELALVDALRHHTDVTLSLPAWPGSERARTLLRRMGFAEQRVAGEPDAAEEAVVAAPTVAQESGEIARRILEQHRSGRPFREMGVVLRTADTYASVLRSTFERFGIPARFYFAEPLAAHAVVRYLAGAVDAMLGGWDHADVLRIFQMTASGVSDRADFALRERLPGSGLDGLHACGGGLVDQLAVMDAWRSESAPQSAWAARLRHLRELFRRPEITDGIDHESAILWRGQAAALDSFDAAVEEAAAIARDEPVPLAEFWRQVKAVLRLSTLRVADARRNVVHVMDAYEARQWRLPVIFLCGLLEKQFPLYHSQNPVIGDETRRRLERTGIWLRTSAERQEEERFLFELAASRAGELRVLTYPRFDAQGQENLPSFFLRGRKTMDAKPVRLRADAPPAAASSAIGRPDLLEALGAAHSSMSPTALEDFLQCPFRFFARHTLKLEPAPPAPEERCDLLVRGSIAHRVIRLWHESHGDLAELLNRVFTETAREKNLAPSYRTEFARLEILRALREFLADPREIPGWRVNVERSFDLPAGGDLIVRGRIDRYDVSPGGMAIVYDYKYSSSARVKRLAEEHDEGLRAQGGLYLLAVSRLFGHEPAAMFYWGLRGGELSGWHIPLSGLERTGEARTPEAMREILIRAEDLAVTAARRVREGVVAPAPANPEGCGWCDFRDVCRVGKAAALAAGGGDV